MRKSGPRMESDISLQRQMVHFGKRPICKRSTGHRWSTTQLLNDTSLLKPARAHLRADAAPVIPLIGHRRNTSVHSWMRLSAWLQGPWSQTAATLSPQRLYKAPRVSATQCDDCEGSLCLLTERCIPASLQAIVPPSTAK